VIHWARLDEVVDWTLFDAVFVRIPRVEPKGLGGRPSFAPAMMFKALVIANLYQLGDRQLEFQITDRLSFKRFLGLTDADKSPDEKTFWAFRETLTRHELIEPLFAIFHGALEAMGMFARKGRATRARITPRSRGAGCRKGGGTSRTRRSRRMWTRAGRRRMASATMAAKTM
jgi:transposase, IS5 family